jgi:ATP-dependent helicase/nuclease subunit B
LAARPTLLPVTDIGLWRRNPYALYAKRILKLRKLDAIEEDIAAADFGTLVHAALERFFSDLGAAWPADAEERLVAAGRAALAPFRARPQAAAFWGARFERLARWIIAFENERRAKGWRPLALEREGRMTLASSLTLIGRADRIDARSDGTIEIIDYKTGAPPTADEVVSGLEPQLPLLGLIAQQGGFEALGPRTVGALRYVQVGAGAEGGKDVPIKGEPAQLIAEAETALWAWIERFADPAMPYRATPRPGLGPRYDDYDHLARLAENGGAV